MEKKKLIILLASLFVIIAGGITAYFIITGNNYITTDNAKVTARMYTVYPASAGKLLEWDIRNGDLVDKDEVLGRTQALPYITSPAKGTVVQDNVSQNQTVTPVTALAVIADTDNMYIGVNIEETKIAKITIGQQADVFIDAYPNVTFKGTVTEIGGTTQTYFSSVSSFTTSGSYTKVTQNIPVKVVIENPDGLPMIFGMNATVKFRVQ